ncbi:hypothetical protein J2S55_008552 [Streptosporangium brasiliense]|uniref:DSBA-like thioredoxin domain-containing protein n=1 Tax=Streptosporangium brasiliense TaxID=47480 RepID=A0ABT9RKE1_9ACTN|nr:hypothetical protein [Streptosporangium brasiliense]
MRQDLGLSARQAAEGVAGLTALAAGLGLTCRLEPARPVNSFDAHRLLHAAVERGLGDQVGERLLRAYTGEEAHLADHRTLADLAGEAGFPAEAARALLRGREHAGAVRADGAEARRRGVSGVPSFVIADGDVVSGAQSPQALLEELRLAWRRATAIVLIGHPVRAVVDGRELSFCDPTGLKTLLKARAAAAGVSFPLCHVRGLRRVPTITGLDAAFPDSPLTGPRSHEKETVPQR